MAGRSDNASATLACEGGEPLRQGQWPPWPHVGEAEVEAAAEVLRSGKINYWTGKQGRQFEAEFAEAVGCRHAVALANGTVALEAALAALDVGPGDEIIVTCRTFVASATCCLSRGATPVFADVDPVSQNITADTIKAELSERTRAIIAVHLAGWPCDMEPILALAREHRLAVIEDCAQAHGATYRGRPVGSWGNLAAFSFCQDKILTTGGEGGMVTTNSEALWERVWSYKDHGKSWEAVQRHDPEAVFKWLHAGPGTNWRMTEMQAAIGRVVLKRLPDWVQARRRLATVLDQRFSQIAALRVTVPPDDVGHSYYKYYAFLRPEHLGDGWTRDRIVKAVQAEGVPCGSGSCPEIYRERVFADLGLQPTGRHAVAQQLGETSLMFQVHPTLEESDMHDAADALEKVLRVATRATGGRGRQAA